MITDLNFKIQCGEKTCAYEKGKFCKYLGTKKLGIIYVCLLFPDDKGSFTVLEDINGWLQRCPDCLKASKKENV